MQKLISLGTIIDKSWDHYREHFVELLSVSGWLLLVALVDILALTFYPPASKLLSGATLTGPETFGVITSFISSTLLAPLLGLWILATLVFLIRKQDGNRHGNVVKAMKEGLHILLPAIWVSLLVMLVLIAGILIGIIPAFIFSGLFLIVNAGILILISNILLVIGIFVSTFFVFRWGVEYLLAPFSLFLENKRGIKALQRSRHLIRGHFWQALLRIAIPKLVFIVVGVIIVAVLAYLSNIVISAVAGLNLDLQVRLISITGAVFPVLVAALINPLIVLADYILYNDLIRVRGTKR